MSFLRYLLILHLSTPLVLGQLSNTKSAVLPNQPKALVQSLYAQVLARHPLGIPEDADMKILAPYLSNALLHRIDVAIDCGADWHRRNPEPHLKPELGWLELGTFSGENERASPQSFGIVKTQTQKDGSYRVYVNLTRSDSEGRPLHWTVAAVVIREEGHVVVDDIIYLKDQDYDESRLSEALSAGCSGPRWVGFGKQQNGAAQEK